MVIRICQNDDDIRCIAELAKRIWNEYFINIITREQIQYMVAKFQSYSALRQAIQNDHYTYFMAYAYDTLIGYCGIQLQDDQRIFLSKLYIEKDHRGKGYASKLLDKAIQCAKEQNMRSIYLTCNKYNTHSLNIYHKKGFYDLDSVQTDIGHGFIMDDYILQLDI